MSVRFACEKCGGLDEAPASSPEPGPTCRSCGWARDVELGLREFAVEGASVAISGAPVPLARMPRLAWSALGVEPSRVGGPTLALILFSGLDLLMTFMLLSTSPHVYESNPVARFVFDRWNMAGMAAFKFGVIGGVVILGELIERQRPGWGRLVLAFGSAAAVVAVLQGLRIYLGHAPIF